LSHSNVGQETLKKYPPPPASSQITKIPDSNEFNYWFEVANLSSGVITIDLSLDEGHPAEQMEFLKLHDLKTKWLYFLWPNDDHETSDLEKETENNFKNQRRARVCGCVGGCYYYSVFDDTTKFEFFNLKKSINRTNANFGRSLFQPELHIHESQPMMMNKYEREVYAYNEQLAKGNVSPGEEDREIRLTANKPSTEPPSIVAHQFDINSVRSRSSSQLNLSKVKANESLLLIGNAAPPQPTSAQIAAASSLASVHTAARLSSTISIRSSLTNREDDYFTAGEEDEDDNEDTKSLSNTLKKKRPSCSKSLASSRSRLSYFSLKDSNNRSVEEDNGGGGGLNESTENETTLNENVSSVPKATESQPITAATAAVGHTVSSAAAAQTGGGGGMFDSENKMDLNFDIKRPILDSSLPKYCYLKYLSRAFVHNWNRTYLYPFYEDATGLNINFNYRQRGLDFANISTSYTPKWNNNNSKSSSHNQPDYCN
jgi:hypothetical protein